MVSELGGQFLLISEQHFVDNHKHLLGRFCGQPLTRFSGNLLEEFLWRVVGQLLDI
jgi:hypothetical protein